MAIYRGNGGAGDSTNDATVSDVTAQAVIASTKADEAAASATAAAASATSVQTLTAATGAAGSSASYNSGTNTLTVPRGDTGATGAAGDDSAWTGGSYASATGVVTFASDDSLGFVTGDLRGATGSQGIQGIQGIQGATGATGAAGADGSGGDAYLAQTQTFTGAKTFSATTVFEAGITEDAVTLTGTSTTIDISAATNFVHDLTGATTYTFSNPAATGNASSFTLKIIQDSTARAITWPNTVDWAGGTAPTLTGTNNGVDVFVFYTIDGGTIYYGFTAGQAMA